MWLVKRSVARRVVWIASSAAVVLGTVVTAMVARSDHATRPAAISDPGPLTFDPEVKSEFAAAVDDIFFARVGQKIGERRRNGWIEVQYEADVLEVLKGNLRGTVVINMLPLGDVHVEGAEDLEPLTGGSTYLFATRAREADRWNTVSIQQGRVLADSESDYARLKAEFLAAISPG